MRSRKDSRGVSAISAARPVGEVAFNRNVGTLQNSHVSMTFPVQQARFAQDAENPSSHPTSSTITGRGAMGNSVGEAADPSHPPAQALAYYACLARKLSLLPIASAGPGRRLGCPADSRHDLWPPPMDGAMKMPGRCLAGNPAAVLAWLGLGTLVVFANPSALAA